jgi:NADH-quinone oxidoreductase subunit H
MISYEVFMVLPYGYRIAGRSFSLVDIIEAAKGMWFVIPQFVWLHHFFIAGIAETHRLPFDDPEAESALIAGFTLNTPG